MELEVVSEPAMMKFEELRRTSVRVKAGSPVSGSVAEVNWPKKSETDGSFSRTSLLALMTALVYFLRLAVLHANPGRKMAGMRLLLLKKAF
jgi:hypothetical protein